MSEQRTFRLTANGSSTHPTNLARTKSNVRRVPAWSPDGREIFYNSGECLMRVSVHTESDFVAGIPELLFEGRYYYENNVRGYDIAPDGQRFLMIKLPDSSIETRGATQINVVLNWHQELERLDP